MQRLLVLLVLGFATVVWLGAAVLTWSSAQDEVDELLDGHLAQSAALLLLQADGDFDDVADNPVLQKYAPQVAFQVYLGEQLVTRTANTGVTPLSVNGDGFSTVLREDGELWRVVRQSEPSHGITVLVGERISSRHAILWAMMRGLIAPTLLALPLFGIGLWWSVRKGLAPIRSLSETLSERAPHAAEPVSMQGMPQELQPLVQTLNGLLERIDRMVRMERRFTADAAHELRTPIAGIRAQAQVAMGAGDDATERQYALQNTLAGCDRAGRLVDQLLTLARLEASPQNPAMPVELALVVRRVVAELAPVALAQQQVVQVLAEGSCPVAANDVLLGVLVRNLVDNALRYSPKRAQVHVLLHSDGLSTVLQVHDSGPGMSAEAIAHLGERFFRVLGSEQPGSGLGWSIVRRLLEVFGARVAVGRSTTLGGLSVTVHLPAVPAASA
jgi:two-component system sensor histidine kinase QseC